MYVKSDFKLFNSCYEDLSLRAQWGDFSRRSETHWFCIFAQWYTVGAGKLWPGGQIYPAAYLYT